MAPSILHWSRYVARNARPIRAAPSRGHRPPRAVRRIATSTPWRGVAIGESIERASTTIADAVPRMFLTSGLTIRAAVESGSPGTRRVRACSATGASRCAAAAGTAIHARRGSRRARAAPGSRETHPPRAVRRACATAAWRVLPGCALAASATVSSASTCVAWRPRDMTSPSRSRRHHSSPTHVRRARHDAGRAILVRPASRSGGLSRRRSREHDPGTARGSMIAGILCGR